MQKCEKFAVEQQKGIVDTAFTLFQKNRIKKCSSFTYAIISHESLGWADQVQVQQLLLRLRQNGAPGALHPAGAH